MAERDGALGRGALGLCRAEQGGQCTWREGAERWRVAQAHRPLQPWEALDFQSACLEKMWGGSVLRGRRPT